MSSPASSSESSPAPPPPAAAPPLDPRVARAVAHLDEVARRGASTPTLAELGRVAGASGSWLQRRFREAVGVSPRAWLEAHRTATARAALRAGFPVAEATFAAGFGSAPRAQAVLTEGLGMPPGRYRRGGAGETLTWQTTRTAIGVVRLAATARGVCWVAIGDDADTLDATMRAEWPAARFVSANDQERSMIRKWLDTASQMVQQIAEGKTDGQAADPDATVPLDLRGTAFRLRVWDALRRISRGEVVDYATLAERIGAPRAVRAVGTACGANPVALLVPCHRVLRRDGAPGGYRWGIERKLALLRAEGRANASGPPDVYNG
jgi:AraC family transcriptional regulator of adaptative response/methylated-DNA-[protein]-cysteine methyltransferase